MCTSPISRSHPNSPGHESLSPDKIPNRPSDLTSKSYDACGAVGDYLVDPDPELYEAVLDVSCEVTEWLEFSSAISVSQPEVESPWIPEEARTPVPFAEYGGYCNLASYSAHYYGHDELSLHYTNEWTEPNGALRFEDASLGAPREENPQRGLRNTGQDSSIFVRMEDVELYSSCLYQEDGDFQATNHRPCGSPIIIEASESFSSSDPRSHSVSDIYGVDGSSGTAQDKPYLQDALPGTKNLAFATKEMQGSPGVEAPSTSNGRTTRVSSQVVSLPKKRKPILLIKLWFNTHLDQPYPCRKDLASLVKNTGLTPQQVRTSLTNLRARRKAKMTSMEISNPIIPLLVGPHSNQFDRSYPSSTITNRTVNVLPENSTDVRQSCAEEDRSHHTASRESELGYLKLDSFISHLNSESAPSSSSCSTGVETASTSSTTISSSSDQGLGVPLSCYNLNLKRRRKGKRLFPPSLKTSARPDKPSALFECIQAEAPKDTKTFYCTFCGKPLNGHYEWKRHEATHVAAIKWICMPESTALWYNSCAFCGLDSPSDAHVAKHNVKTCLEKPVDDRSFSRKDHLKQHVEQVHSCKERFNTGRAGKVLQSWGKEVDSSEFCVGVLWCGFCKCDLSSWGERVEHIAAHFQGGVTMQDWAEKQP
ncbi:hypothetical protein AOQ84DRAFT_416937 [Glonium stellatum]|uniref:C2H2-type domain-containing protein n=1 Tax=Glonium stellatum TaxID=574774 RepID=A0A8E2JNW1_9PEZI|nr:hypothetical protein AOQ84DRAFT_416937 [Glonium stellatum]